MAAADRELWEEDKPEDEYEGERAHPAQRPTAARSQERLRLATRDLRRDTQRNAGALLA
jgi:hypothetical protein